MSETPRRGWAAWLPPLLWCALIFAGSSVPASSGRRLFPGADRVVHFGEFAVLGLLLARALRQGGASPARSLALGALLGAAFGASDEIHQAFVPEREPEWGDFAADALGSLAGAAAYAGFRRLRGGGAPIDSGAAPDPRP